jgi:hypothetical protein
MKEKWHHGAFCDPHMQELKVWGSFIHVLHRQASYDMPLQALKTTLKTMWEQLTASSSSAKSSLSTSEVYFTNNFISKAKQRGLSEKDALDVYYHGQDRKDNMRCRTYNGYELCIYYGHNPRTGQPLISTIWKRERR